LNIFSSSTDNDFPRNFKKKNQISSCLDFRRKYIFHICEIGFWKKFIFSKPNPYGFVTRDEYKGGIEGVFGGIGWSLGE